MEKSENCTRVTFYRGKTKIKETMMDEAVILSIGETVFRKDGRIYDKAVTDIPMSKKCKYERTCYKFQ